MRLMECDYNSRRRGVLVLVGFLVVLVAYQNCNKIDFNGLPGADVPVNPGPLGPVPPPIGPNEVSRELKIDPITNENRPKIHVTTIVDNSSSMQHIQNRVENAFRNVIDKLRDFDGDLALYTTTQDLRKDNIDYYPSFLEVKDYLTYTDLQGNQIQLPLDQVNQVPTEIPYQVHSSILLSKPMLPNGEKLSFNRSMSDDEFGILKEAYTTSIGQLGEAGSDQEQTLCTLYRVLKEQEKSLQDGFNIYLLATNQDDVTSLNDCRAAGSQEVAKKKQVSSVTEACLAEDLECLNTYKVQYLPRNRKSISYSYRNISGFFDIRTTASQQVKTASYQYNSHHERLSFSVYRKSEALKYEKYINVDGVYLPSGTVETFDLGSSEGSCGVTPQPCSDQQKAKLDAPYGLVSCNYTCTQSTSASLQTNWNGWSGGTCESDNLSSHSGCTEQEKSSFGVASRPIASCNFVCENSNSGNKSMAVSTALANGSGCDDSVKSQIIAAGDSFSPGYVEAKDIVSCTIGSYTESINYNLTNRANIFQCLGMSESETKTNQGVWQTCTQEQKDFLHIVDPTRDLSKVTACRDRCSQSVTARNDIQVEIPSSCTLGTSSCSKDEARLFEYNRYGTNRNVGYFSSQCSYQCSSVPSTPCTPSLAGGNLCEKEFSNSNPLIQACLKTGFDLATNSANFCAITKSEKKVDQTTYVPEEQPWQYISLFEANASVTESENIVNSVATLLSSVNRSQFYTGFFTYPPGDPVCNPDQDVQHDNELTVGERFLDLAERINLGIDPDKYGKVYPLCDSDYSGSLDFMVDLAIKSLERSYLMDIKSNEVVISVELIDVAGNSSRFNAPSDRYVQEGKILTFSEHALDGISSVVVTVKGPK